MKYMSWFDNFIMIVKFDEFRYSLINLINLDFADYVTVLVLLIKYVH
jgi:hypothetical protein